MEMNTAIIGLGYWGKNLLRNVVLNHQTSKLFICDTDQDRMYAADSMYKVTGGYSNPEKVFENEDINNVIIATPTKTHFKLAYQALNAGKNVLVEKPMTTSSEETKTLIALAEEKNKILMVDHVYLYNPAVLKLKQLINDTQKIGPINYIDSTRINLGIYQEDVNVLWDLACHDISIINYLIHETPTSVRAIGRINPHHGVEDIAYLFMQYPSDLLVQVNSSWASPVKMRKMIIGGGKQMIIYDDIEPTNKLTIYDYESKVIDDRNKSKLTDYRLGNISLPKYEPEEALKNVISSFYASVVSGIPPLADGKNALEVIKILESAQESLKLGGLNVPIA